MVFLLSLVKWHKRFVYHLLNTFIVLIGAGLKEYSNWPTYPQLYIKGELIGGLDIIKELVAGGEFASILSSTKNSLNDRLKMLINQQPVMLFMKGSPDSPKCGFSKTMIAILQNKRFDLTSFYKNC